MFSPYQVDQRRRARLTTTDVAHLLLCPASSLLASTSRGDDLIEPRHMLLCPRCATPIGYQSEKGDVKAGPFVYLFVR